MARQKKAAKKANKNQSTLAMVDDGGSCHIEYRMVGVIEPEYFSVPPSTATLEQSRLLSTSTIMRSVVSPVLQNTVSDATATSEAIADSAIVDHHS